MKKLMKLEGVKLLSKTEKKSIIGYGNPLQGDCSGEPNQTLCYFNGHKRCPGWCLQGVCQPW